MPSINITAAGAAGSHFLSRTNVHVAENFIYYTGRVGDPVTFPTQATEGAPFIYRGVTGALTGLTSGNLYYAKVLDKNSLQFSTTVSSGVAGTAADITAVGTGGISLDYPYVYNNQLNINTFFADQQAVKYFTNSTPLTGLASGTTYYVKNTNTGLAPSPLYSFTTFNFTSAGVTGRIGPTLAQLQSAYSATAFAAGGVFLTQGTFQGYQDWTVPVSGIYELTVRGASGRDSGSNANSGRGAVITARVTLVRGEIITIAVGQRGSISSNTAWPASSGGTFVVRKADNTPLIVAGGGSSSSNNQPGRDAVLTNAGDNAAAGVAGGGAAGFGAPGRTAGGGGGGFFSSGGNSTFGFGGFGFNVGLVGGTGTTAGPGADGGFGGGGGSDAQAYGAPGGAGGYSGGAAGPALSTTSGGGGGSFITSNATNVATSNGTYNGSSTFNGVAITNTGTWVTDADGGVTATLVSSSSTGITLHPTATDAAANTNAIAIAPAGSDLHSLIPITLDLTNNTINTTSQHGLSSGDALTYNFTGAPATPLTSNFTYYVDKVNNYSYRLSTTPSPTFTNVTFTQPSSATFESFGKVVVNTATDIITIPSHGFLVNQPVNYQVSGTTLKSIASISRSGTLATVTTTTNHNFDTGRSIVIEGSGNNDLNGTYTITSTGLTTFTYNTTTTGTLTSILGGTANVNHNVPISSISRTGSTVTVTTSIHGFTNGQTVKIAGVSTDLNGNYTITSVPSTTTFTYTTPTTGSITVSGSGTAAVNVAIAPLQDNATYYVKTVVDANNIKLSQALNGPAIDFTSAGLGTSHSFLYVVVNLVEDSLYIPGHGYVTGTKLVYGNAGGTSIGGLTSGSSYFVFKIDDNIIKLTNTVGGPIINLTTLGTGNHTLTTNAVDFVTNQIAIPDHGFSQGELVQYDSVGQTVINGLVSGNPYYVILIDGNNIALASTLANAQSGTRVDLVASPAAVGTHKILSLSKSPDGTYTVASVPSTTTFSVTANGFVPTIVKAFNPRRVVNLQQNTIQILSHGFITGTRVTYSNGGDSNIGGLTTGTDYYAINITKDYIRLATSAENASSGVPVTLTSWGAGIGHTLTTAQINGYVTGSGTVATVSGSTLVNGTGTAFSKILKNGDIFRLFPADTVVSSTGIPTTAIAVNPTNTFTITAHPFVTGDNVIFETTGTAPTGLVAGYYYFIRKIDNNTIKLFNTASDATSNLNPVTFTTVGSGLTSFHKNTPNAPIIRKITAIGSDSQVTVDRPYATTYTGRSYSYATFIYVRPQGYSLHRPFDGGVEMSVGTNTSFGQIIRQTRKYFRYQSGKGLQTSFGINFKPTIDIENLVRVSSTTFQCTTRRPHSLISGLTVKISEAETSTGTPSTVFNGNFQVTVQDPFTFTCIAATTIPTGVESTAYGFPQFNVLQWQNGAIRAGMFDFQNGMFFEFDGQKLYCVRRSSTQQLAGTASALQGSEFVFGTGTQFSKQLDAGDFIVMRGQTYKVSSILSDTRITVKPEYKGSSGSEVEFNPGDGTTGVVRTATSEFVIQSHGLTQLLPVVYNSIDGTPIGGLINGRTYYVDVVDNNRFALKATPDAVSDVTISDAGAGFPHSFTPAKSGIIITKTVDTRTPQEEFSIDKLDGTGPTGYNIDLTKIQMAYIDYSWYGAGKIRYGFKTRGGEVQYVHEYIHNNFKLESYFRSGNLPTRYEVATFDTPTYIPFLFHWGTSVIMDGKFDDDKAYLFTQNSQTLQVSGTTAKSFGSRAIDTTLERIAISTHGFTTGDAVTFLSLQANGQPGSNFQNPTIISQAAYAFNNLQNNSTFYVRVFDANTIQLHPTLADAGAGIGAGGTNTIQFTNNLAGQGNSQYTYYLYPLGSSNNTSGTNYQPLLSLRLSPSVSSGLTGKLGDRDILNRMQLAIKELAVSTTNLVDVKVLINPRLNNLNFAGAPVPSLTQYIQHTLNDTVSGGTQIYNFRASGGASGAELASTVNLSDLYDIGNSILGGDSVFPDGPDILTVAVARLTGNTTLTSAKLTWTEAQA
jgi:hypothetical protein